MSWYPFSGSTGRRSPPRVAMRRTTAALRALVSAGLGPATPTAPAPCTGRLRWGARARALARLPSPHSPLPRVRPLGGPAPRACAARARGASHNHMTQPPQAHLPRTVHHEPPAHAPNAALMIDFDNVTMGIRSDLQSELRRLLQSDIIKGKVAVQRAYADWRRYPQYIVPLAESSIDMIWEPAYGSNKKNATDIRLAVDALELVFTRPEDRK